MLKKVFPEVKERAGELESMNVFLTIWSIAYFAKYVGAETWSACLELLLSILFLLKILIAIILFYHKGKDGFVGTRKFTEYLQKRNILEIYLWCIPYIYLLTILRLS